MVKFAVEFWWRMLLTIFPSKRSSKISFQTSPEVRHQFRRKLRQLHSGNRWCLDMSQILKPNTQSFLNSTICNLFWLECSLSVQGSDGIAKFGNLPLPIMAPPSCRRQRRMLLPESSLPPSSAEAPFRDANHLGLPQGAAKGGDREPRTIPTDLVARAIRNAIRANRFARIIRN